MSKATEKLVNLADKLEKKASPREDFESVKRGLKEALMILDHGKEREDHALEALYSMLIGIGLDLQKLEGKFSS